MRNPYHELVRSDEVDMRIILARYDLCSLLPRLGYHLNLFPFLNVTNIVYDIDVRPLT